MLGKNVNKEFEWEEMQVMDVLVYVQALYCVRHFDFDEDGNRQNTNIIIHINQIGKTQNKIDNKIRMTHNESTTITYQIHEL